jgi:hypothetical protein
MDDNILYNRIISENLEKGFQVRLVVNEFREVVYIQLRKYFLNYEGEWLPSREGISIPASFENVTAMLDGLLEICAQAEGDNIIEKYYRNINHNNF